MVTYKRLLNGSLFVLLAILLMSATSVFYIGVNTVQAAADTCTWTGDGGDTDLTNGGNWTGCDNSGVPENGDSLVFPDGPVNKTVLLDIYLTYESITFSGSDYVVNAAGSESLAPTVELIISGDNNTFNSGVRYFNPTENIRFEHSGTGTVFANSIVVQTPDPPAVEFTLQIDSDVSVPNFAHAGDPEPLSVVRKTGVGTLTISGSVVAGLTADTIEINGGTWKCDHWNCLGDDTNPIVITGNDDVYLQLNAPADTQDIQNPITLDGGVIDVPSSSAVMLSGNIDLSDAGGIINVDGLFDIDGDIALVDTLDISGEGGVQLDGTISGINNLVIGNSYTIISGNNTYTGSTNLLEGSQVEIQHNNALGATEGGTTINDGASLIPANGVDVPEPLTVLHNGIDESSLGALYIPAESGTTVAEFSGTITIDSSMLIGMNDDSSLTLSGVIEGTGSLVMREGEVEDLDTTVNIAGPGPNTLSGTMTIYGTDVNFDKNSSAINDIYVTAIDDKDASLTTASDVTDAIADDAPITLTNTDGATATLTFEADETIGGLRGTGVVDATGVELTLNVDANSTYYGLLTVDTLVKTGESTQELENDLNANTIEINGGDVAINGSTTATVTVAEDAIIKGTGETGNMNLAGTLAPGQSPGIITINGDLDLTGGTLEVEVDGSVVGSQYDQTVVTGTATLNNTNLSLEMNFTPTNGDVFTLLRADTIDGEFNFFPDGATGEMGGLTLRVDYNLSDTGEDTFTLTILDGGLPVPGAPNTGFQRQNMLPYITGLTIGAILLLWQTKPARRRNQ